MNWYDATLAVSPLRVQIEVAPTCVFRLVALGYWFSRYGELLDYFVTPENAQTPRSDEALALEFPGGYILVVLERWFKYAAPGNTLASDQLDRVCGALVVYRKTGALPEPSLRAPPQSTTADCTADKETEWLLHLEERVLPGILKEGAMPVVAQCSSNDAVLRQFWISKSESTSTSRYNVLEACRPAGAEFGALIATPYWQLVEVPIPSITGLRGNDVRRPDLVALNSQLGVVSSKQASPYIQMRMSYTLPYLPYDLKKRAAWFEIVRRSFQNESETITLRPKPVAVAVVVSSPRLPTIDDLVKMYAEAIVLADSFHSEDNTNLIETAVKRLAAAVDGFNSETLIGESEPGKYEKLNVGVLTPLVEARVNDIRAREKPLQGFIQEAYELSGTANEYNLAVQRVEKIDEAASILEKVVEQRTALQRQERAEVLRFFVGIRSALLEYNLSHDLRKLYNVRDELARTCKLNRFKVKEYADTCSSLLETLGSAITRLEAGMSADQEIKVMDDYKAVLETSIPSAVALLGEIKVLNDYEPLQEGTDPLVSGDVTTQKKDEFSFDLEASGAVDAIVSAISRLQRQPRPNKYEESILSESILSNLRVFDARQKALGLNSEAIKNSYSRLQPLRPLIAEIASRIDRDLSDEQKALELEENTRVDIYFSFVRNALKEYEKQRDVQKLRDTRNKLSTECASRRFSVDRNRRICSRLLEKLSSSIILLESSLSVEEEAEVVAEMESLSLEDIANDELFEDPNKSYVSTLQGTAKTSFVPQPQPQSISLVQEPQPQFVTEWAPVSAQRATLVSAPAFSTKREKAKPGSMFGPRAVRSQVFSETQPIYDQAECSDLILRYHDERNPVEQEKYMVKFIDCVKTLGLEGVWQIIQDDNASSEDIVLAEEFLYGKDDSGLGAFCKDWRTDKTRHRLCWLLKELLDKKPNYPNKD
jgi:hypothetical protein